MVKRKYRCVMGCANGIGRVCLFIKFVAVYREGNKHTFHFSMFILGTLGLWW